MATSAKAAVGIPRTLALVVAALHLAVLGIFPGQANGCDFSCGVGGVGVTYIYGDTKYVTKGECNAFICKCWSEQAATLAECKKVRNWQYYNDDASCATETGDVYGYGATCPAACGRGQRVTPGGGCTACADGQYMYEEFHQNEKCLICVSQCRADMYLSGCSKTTGKSQCDKCDNSTCGAEGFRTGSCSSITGKGYQCNKCDNLKCGTDEYRTGSGCSSTGKGYLCDKCADATCPLANQQPVCAQTAPGYTCQCKPGFTGDRCQYSTDATHCNNLGKVQANGKCKCQDGTTGLYCQCVSPDDPSGACLQCASATDTYTGSKCATSATTACNGRGIDGDAASTSAYCAPCADPNAAGPACQYTKAGTCNNHGTPKYDGSCELCDAEHAGRNCEFSRAGTCDGHGTPSAKGACTCDIGYNASSQCSDCATRVDGNTCSSCEPQYLNATYPTCHIDACSPQHTQSLDKQARTCRCKPGWSGPRCACFKGLGANASSPCLSCAKNDPQMIYALLDGKCSGSATTSTTTTTATTTTTTTTTTTATTTTQTTTTATTTTATTTTTTQTTTTTTTKTTTTITTSTTTKTTLTTARPTKARVANGDDDDDDVGGSCTTPTADDADGGGAVIAIVASLASVAFLVAGMLVRRKLKARRGHGNDTSSTTFDNVAFANDFDDDGGDDDMLLDLSSVALPATTPTPGLPADPSARAVPTTAAPPPPIAANAHVTSPHNQLPSLDQFLLPAPGAKPDWRSKLGAGSSADVYPGTFKFSKRQPAQKVAFKKFRDDILGVLRRADTSQAGSAGTRAITQMARELRIGSRIQHDNLVQYYGIVHVNSNSTCLVMELLPDGTLKDMLHAGTGPLDTDVSALLAKDIASGMQALHASKPHPIIHRDLKSHNVLLFSNKTRAKVADFGLAKPLMTTAGSTYGGAGTLAWSAPETFAGVFAEASDVFSFGIVLFEMLSRQEPYAGLSQQEIMRRAQARFVFDAQDLRDHGWDELAQRRRWFNRHPLSERRPDLAQIPAGSSSLLVDVMRQAWVDAPQARVTFEQVLSLLSGVHKLGHHARTNWQSDGRSLSKLFDVQRGDPEFDGVVRAVHATLPTATVTQVQRVENATLHEAFHLKLNDIKSQLGSSFVDGRHRRQLFHGTTAVTEIACGTTGFEPRLSGSSTGQIHGVGSYFARDAKYGKDYALRVAGSSTDEKQMFLVDVVVGRWEKGARDKKFFSAVPRTNPPQLHNSFVDNVRDPTIFVIPVVSMAYPKYLIQFAITPVPDLHKRDINLARVTALLQDQKTQAIRLHGSHDAQRLLGEVTLPAQMATLRNRTSPPVVVLVGGDAANTKLCAGHLRGAWDDALARSGVAGSQQGKAWYVSNHSFAVSMDDIGTEVPQNRLPPGCAS